MIGIVPERFSSSRVRAFIVALIPADDLTGPVSSRGHVHGGEQPGDRVRQPSGV